MPVKPRGSSWQATVHHKGGRYRKDFIDKQEAEIWEAETKAALLKGIDPKSLTETGPKVPTIQELLDDVIFRVWGPKKAGKMLALNGRQVVNLIGGDRLASTLCAADAHKVKTEFLKRGRSDATINRKLAALSVLFREAVDLDYIPKKPKVGITKERNHRKRYFKPEEERAMLDWCDKMGDEDLRDYIVYSIDTGFRQGEVLKQTPGHIEGHDMWALNTKNYEDRLIPLTDRAYEVAQRRGKFLGKDERLFAFDAQFIRDRWRQMQTALGHAEDTEYLPHTLRHTFVTRLLQSGTDIKTAQTLAGHKNITTTQGYAHTSTEFQKLAIQRLSGYTPHATM